MAPSPSMIVKANQHYQLTIPVKMREKMSIGHGMLFSVLQADDGILFRPLKFQNSEDVFADEMDAEEIKEMKASLGDIQTGKYTKIETSSELKEHLDALKQ